MNKLDTVKKYKNRVYQMLQQSGWINTSLYLFSRLLVVLSRGNIKLYKYYLIAQPVIKTPLLSPRRGGKIKVRLVCEQDEVIQQFPRPAHIIQARFEHGAKCLAAFKDEQFIGFLWLLFDSYQEDEVRARYTPLPAEKTAWDFDIYIAPDYRFGLAFARLWDEANHILGKHGAQWTCSRISALNIDSLNSHMSIGAKSLGSVIFFCISQWQITFSSVFPYFHLSFHPGSFPEFRLKTQAVNDSFFSL